MKRDLRDPEVLGKLLMKMQKTYPDMSAPDRADLLEQLSSTNIIPDTNGNGHGKWAS